MLEGIHLQNFKGFKNFSVTFGDETVLVGPNNAGKSTLIGALRLCAALLAQIPRKTPQRVVDMDGEVVRAFDLPPTAIESADFNAENVRHEFEDKESRLRLRFTSAAELCVSWPVDDAPWFYLKPPVGGRPTYQQMATYFTAVGAVPTLAPVEFREPLLNDRYVRKNITGRLTSRHFRNQLLLENARDDVFEDLVDFILVNTPEISSLDVTLQRGDASAELDVFYTETATGRERELCWAGDGLQVWLQTLTHLWRFRERDTVVLDEPDVYLHPDLQRRLIRVAEQPKQQLILATHSPEVVAEARPGSVTWVDRVARRARRANDDTTLAEVGGRLGSALAFALARAFRSRLALFVEGEDHQILRLVAGAVGAENVATESELVVIPLGGFSQWDVAASFSKVMNMLGGSLHVFVLLDRDHRAQQTVDEVMRRLTSSGAEVHVWRRKEIESYLLVPEPVARLTGLQVQVVTECLEYAISSVKDKARVALLGRRHEEARRSIDPRTVTERGLREFEEYWEDPQKRLDVVPPKEILGDFNGRLRAAGGKRDVGWNSVAREIQKHEVPQEMARVLLDIDARLSTE